MGGIVGENLFAAGGKSPFPLIFENGFDGTSVRSIMRGVGGEIQLTDAIAARLKGANTYAHRFEGQRFDCGSKQGFLTATAHYARLAGYDFI